ncbi:MAG: hypothetical protein HY514_04380 [Candidatus Aenigmarchaeota archaeon]|nr:hypothetical protein [Candidatus Aenigmarchaeota archaeon]
MKKTHFIIAVVVLFISIYLIATKEIHEHADFAVYINGEKLNFSQDKYMHHETAEEEKSEKHGQQEDEKAHMHDNVGWIAHKHAADATWGIFFRNINITFNSACFVFEGSSYCSNETHNLRMFVNGREDFEFGGKKINDLDRVLITFDNSRNIDAQLNSVTDEACLYSRKCPERGEAGSEGCVTGGKQCT